MTRPVTVIHLVPTLFGAEGILGGAERFALELARHMAEATPTELITFGSQNETRTIGHLKVHVISNAWRVRGQATNQVSLSLFTKLRNADVVHCHQQHVLASSLAALFCRLLGRRVFVTDLGGGGWDISGYISTDRWYDGHLHISEYSRNIFGHSRNPAAHVIWGGVDVNKFSPDESVPRVSTVLYVGRLLPHKGINDLISALPEGCRLEIIGRPYDAKYFEHLRRLANGKPIIFRQDCDDDALVQAYRRAACVVLPSVYRTLYGDESRVPELLGQTLLEGMACGTPGICTDVASLPEVVEDGVTGFVVHASDLIQLADRVRWVVGHPAEARVMGVVARQHVLSKFTWPQVVQRCLAAYQERTPGSFSYDSAARSGSLVQAPCTKPTSKRFSTA